MPEILGAKSHLFLSSEAVWGTTDAVPTWVHLPVFDYGVRFRPESRNAQPYIGLRQRKHGMPLRGMPSGPIATSLFGQKHAGAAVSLAQYLIDWAFLNPESLDLPSKSAQWTEGPNVANKIHAGLRVNTATLSGSDDGGVIDVSLDTMGKSEAPLATAQTVPVDHELLQEFLFQHATLTLAGVVTPFKSFQWQAANALEVNYLNSFSPSLITAGDRVDSLSLTLVKNSDTYDAYRRLNTPTEFTAILKLKGLLNGTGALGMNYTVCTITFNRLRYADHEDQKAFNQITKIPLSLDVLKPDSASNAITIAWTEEA